MRRKIVRVRFDHGGDLCFDRRLKKLLRDEHYCFMPIVAPRESSMRGNREQQNAQYAKRFHCALPRGCSEPTAPQSKLADTPAPPIRESFATKMLAFGSDRYSKHD